MTTHELTDGEIHPSYIGMGVFVSPPEGRRKPIFIGWLYSETEHEFTVRVPPQHKRKYRDRPAFHNPGGVYKFYKNGDLFIQE